MQTETPLNEPPITETAETPSELSPGAESATIAPDAAEKREPATSEPDLAPSAGWSPEMKSCCIVGFGSGVIGAIVGVIASVILGFGQPGQRPIEFTLPTSETQSTAHPPDPLPIVVDVVPAKSGTGLVVQIRNDSVNDIKNAVLLFEDPSNGTAKRVALDFWLGGEMVQIGRDNSWIVKAGQRLSIQAPGYIPYSIKLK